MTEMDCRQSRELVCACVDEELEQEIAVSVLRHLGDCPSCEELYLVQRTIKALLHRSCSGSTVAPAGLRERVWASVVGQCHGQGEAAVTVNATQTTISTTTSHANGVLVQRTTVTGTVVRATFRGPLAPDACGDQQV